MEALPRNPWTGVSAWRELGYDAAHPIAFARRARAGVLGRNPQVGRGPRALGAALVCFGLAQVALGLALILR